MGARAINREEGLDRCAAIGWHGLVGKAYDAVEATPGFEIVWIGQSLGLLRFELAPRPVPAGLLWRLAAIERRSGQVCQVCGLPGGQVFPERPVHWPADEIRIYCRYHADCAEMGLGLSVMTDERLSVLANAGPEVRPILLEDVAIFSPEDYRQGIIWLSEAQPCDAGEGCVHPQRVEWVLDQGSDAQLAACRPEDFEPFFTWDEAPSVKAAAMAAVSRLHDANGSSAAGDPSPSASDGW
jgi:hypothetical protein